MESTHHKNDLDVMPRDLLIEIFACLDAVTQHKLRRVCSAWNSFILKCAGLRVQVVLEWTLPETVKYGCGSSWQTMPLAFASCLGPETRVVVLRITMQKVADWRLNTISDLPICYGYFHQDGCCREAFARTDWMRSLFLNAEWYEASSQLHTIVFQDFSQRECELDLDDIPEFAASVTKIVMVNTRLWAFLGDGSPGEHGWEHGWLEVSELCRKWTICKAPSWPWVSDRDYGAVIATCTMMGPLDEAKAKVFEENVAEFSANYSSCNLEKLKKYTGKAMTGHIFYRSLEKKFGCDAVADGLTKLDLDSLRRCQPWIQQVMYLVCGNKLESMLYDGVAEVTARVMAMQGQENI